MPNQDFLSLISNILGGGGQRQAPPQSPMGNWGGLLDMLRGVGGGNGGWSQIGPPDASGNRIATGPAMMPGGQRPMPMPGGGLTAMPMPMPMPPQSASGGGFAAPQAQPPRSVSGGGFMGPAISGGTPPTQGGGSGRPVRATPSTPARRPPTSGGSPKPKSKPKSQNGR